MSLDALLPDALSHLLVQVVAVVLLSRALAPLLRRFGQPMVLAEIGAGILLGPSVLGWLAPGAEHALFAPDSLPPLQVASALGVVLFMFMIGLQLDPKLLRGHEGRAVVVSQASIALPFVGGVLLAQHLPAPGGSGPVFSLFLGTAMSATAFPVLARILSERRLLGTRLGAITLACAAVDDVTFWCLLAFVVALARAHGLQDALTTAGLTVGYLLVMFVLVRPLLRRLDQRASGTVGQGTVALIVLLLFVSSWVTDWIGIQALFGAFVLGVILPKEGGLAHALVSRLEDLVLIVLLPLFYAYSGSRTDLGLVHSLDDWLTCALVFSVACAGKLGGSAITARLTGLSWRESGALGVLMNTRGLKELIILNLGLDLGVLSPSLFAMMVLMGIGTTVMTSPLLRWLSPEKQELAPPEPVLDEAEPFRVLICVASGRSGPGLVALASALGAGRPGRPVRALHLLEPTDRVSFVLEQVQDPEDYQGFKPLMERAEELVLSVRPMSFVSTEPSVDICRVAEAQETDLVLMGWHRPQINPTLLDGTVHQVLQHARGAVVTLLVGRSLSQLRRILVLFGRSPHDAAVLHLAHRLARQGSEVTVVHAPEAEAEARRAAGPGLALRAVRAFSLVDGVLAECHGHDLLIVGVGKSWELEQHRIGLHAERLMQESPIPVLVVRSSEKLSATARSSTLRRSRV
jgi:Kef-type K+ transport system membrane component KefB/nucleotide-binding universal stress UspA family protein